MRASRDDNAVVRPQAESAAILIEHLGRHFGRDRVVLHRPANRDAVAADAERLDPPRVFLVLDRVVLHPVEVMPRHRSEQPVGADASLGDAAVHDDDRNTPPACNDEKVRPHLEFDQHHGGGANTLEYSTHHRREIKGEIEDRVPGQVRRRRFPARVRHRGNDDINAGELTLQPRNQRSRKEHLANRCAVDPDAVLGG